VVPKKDEIEANLGKKAMEDAPTRSLREALSQMTWRPAPGLFALVGFEGGPRVEDLALLGRAPSQIVREAEGTTLLIHEDAVDGVLGRHPGAKLERSLVWIRFSAAMDWELVGFLAHVTQALAAAKVPVGCVCTFDRDHLFVAEAHYERAAEVLKGLFPEDGEPR
jgi:hypothetical protein